MRGQISLEYLIIALIAIALVSLSLSVLMKIRENADRDYALIRVKSASEDIFNAIDALCALGNGNSRKVTLPLPLEFYSEAKVVTAGNSDSSFSHKSNCELSLSGRFENELVLENSEGIIIRKP